MAGHQSELDTDAIGNYLYQSIADIQGAIRATDIKVGFLLVIVFAPLVAFDKVQPYLQMIFQEGAAQRWLCIAAVALWGLSFAVQFTALFAISNPAKRVRGGDQVGTFYSNDLFDLGFVDIFVNRPCVAKKTVQQEAERLPKVRQALIEDLTFEKMKLTYVRSVKLVRLNAAVILMGAGMILFAASYAMHLAKAC